VQVAVDGETAMDYAEARMYQPRTGRFSAPDAVFIDLANPQRLNRYGYALANPLGYTDPTGLTAANCTYTEVQTDEGVSSSLTCTEPDSGGGSTGNWWTWSMDFLLGTEPVGSADLAWTEHTPSGAYVPSKPVQAAVVALAVVASIPAANEAIGAVVGKTLGKSEATVAAATADTLASRSYPPARGFASTTERKFLMAGDVIE
jgi:RHS repeat-associated protein